MIFYKGDENGSVLGEKVQGWMCEMLFKVEGWIIEVPWCFMVVLDV